MKLRSFTSLFLLVCLVTTLFLSGCNRNNDCSHDWVDYGCEKYPYCPICGASGDRKEHNFEGTSCFQYGTCTYCEHVQEWSEHQWVEATATEPEYCSVCGVKVTLPEVTDQDLNKMPALSTEMKRYLNACSLQNLGHEINTMMAQMLSAYNYYLDNGDIFLLTKTVDLALDRLGAITGPLSTAAEELDIPSLEATVVSINLCSFQISFTFIEILCPYFLSEENNDDYERHLIESQYKIRDIINDYSEEFYGKKLI